MKTQTNYEAVSWDFDDTWEMTSYSAEQTTETVNFVDAYRLISFDLSSDKPYVIALGDKSMVFFKSE